MVPLSASDYPLVCWRDGKEAIRSGLLPAVHEGSAMAVRRLRVDLDPLCSSPCPGWRATAGRVAARLPFGIRPLSCRETGLVCARLDNLPPANQTCPSPLLRLGIPAECSSACRS